jgi:hypothetical protein
MNYFNLFKMSFYAMLGKTTLKSFYFLLILLSLNCKAFSDIKEIQISSPADGEVLMKLSISFQWVPLNEEGVSYKITLAKLSQDSGMKIRNQKNLEKAPEEYFDSKTKIYTETTKNNSFNIEDLEVYFKIKEPGEKSETPQTGSLQPGMGGLPVDFYAWQVEGFKNGKVVAQSNISIFLYNKLVPPPEPIFIKLLSPENGAVVTPENVNLCWSGLAQQGIVYKINYIYEIRDTLSKNIQNPFAYLSSTQEQKTLDSLIYTIDSVETGFWENLSASMPEITGKAIAYKNKFGELAAKISKRAKVIGLKIEDSPCVPKDSCYYESIWKKLDANKTYNKERFIQAYQCLLNQVNTQNSMIQDLLAKHYLTENTWNKPVNYDVDYGIYNSFENFVNYLLAGNAASTDNEQEALQKAYSISNCLNELNRELIAVSASKEFAKTAIEVLKKESDDYKSQLAVLKDSIEVKRQRDMLQIDSYIGIAVGDAVSQISLQKSCGPSLSDTIIFEFPPYDDASLCSNIFYSSLSKYLNDRLCYLRIKIFYVPKSNTATWLWTGPEKTTITGCFPKLPIIENVATVDEKGSGSQICFPATQPERTRLIDILQKHPNGKWDIEAAKEGQFVFSSERRDIITQQNVQAPVTKNEKKEEPQKQGCKCSLRLMLNRSVVPPPPAKKIVSADSNYEIGLDGKCEGDCYLIESMIKIDVPGIYYGSLNLPSPPGLYFGSKLYYNFPFCGTYTVHGKQVNTEGSTYDTFIADVSCKLADKTEKKETTVNNSTECPTCACMVLFNKTGKIKSEIINDYLFLGKPGKAVIVLESHCFKPCEPKRDIEWQITEPDSRKFTKKGKNLYELKYNFRKKGKYRICVIESTKCPGKIEKCWAFLLVNTGE